MTDKLEQTIRDGLAAISSLLEVYDVGQEDATKWISQISAAGDAFNELSTMSDDKQKSVCIRLAKDVKNFVDVYFEIRKAFPDLVKLDDPEVSKKHQANLTFFQENHLVVYDDLFEAFKDYLSEMTNEKFHAMNEKFNITPESISTTLSGLSQRVRKFTENQWGGILNDEVVIGEDRFMDWWKMVRSVERFGITCGLILVRILNPSKTQLSQKEAFDFLTAPQTSLLNDSADYLFKEGNVQNWIKRAFQKNFDSTDVENEKPIEMKMDDEHRLDNVARFMWDRWRQSSGTAATPYKFFVFRGHIPKEKDEFNWRITGYKNFDPKKMRRRRKRLPRRSSRGCG